jgi:hypothetical protein
MLHKAHVLVCLAACCLVVPLFPQVLHTFPFGIHMQCITCVANLGHERRPATTESTVYRRDFSAYLLGGLMLLQVHADVSTRRAADTGMLGRFLIPPRSG